MLLCNAIPHLCSGLLGRAFPTPFAKPHGRGPSSPRVNFLWGYANLLAAFCLLQYKAISIGANLDFILLMLGALAIGTAMSRHFGLVMEEWGGHSANDTPPQ
jgi:hypothetical protein